jgi:hypothetical protein
LHAKYISRKVPLCVLLLTLFGLLFCKASVGLPGTPKSRKWKISAKQQAFLETVERDTFNFFWETSSLKNGLTPDRFPGAEMSSVAGMGFALTAYVVGSKRGYITRAQAAERTLTTLKFLWRAPQGPASAGAAGYKGFFYHFLDMDAGKRSPDAELSTIDTALLMAGVLSAETFFDADTPAERKIRDHAEALYRRVDWPWAYSRWQKPLISMGWLPESGFIPNSWHGYNEAMILYILALASPTHAIDRGAWDKWTSTYEWNTFYGYPHVNFGPLFGHQYSHIWIDFRKIQDKYMRAKGIDYFVNSRRATFANRAYCIDNPKKWRGYNDLLWGLTASDGPVEGPGKKGDFHSYWARGCSAGYIRDDGTIAPTASGGSVAFAPEIAVPALEHMYANLGDRAYGKYGFKDAFNLSYRQAPSVSQGWFGRDYLAIDQGPILLMIENYRSGLVWNLMKRNAHIKSGLRRAGFSGGWLDSVPSEICSPAH